MKITPDGTFFFKILNCLKGLRKTFICMDANLSNAGAPPLAHYISILPIVSNDYGCYLYIVVTDLCLVGGLVSFTC